MVPPQQRGDTETGLIQLRTYWQARVVSPGLSFP